MQLLVNTDTITKISSGDVQLDCHTYTVLNNTDINIEVDNVPVPAQSSFTFPYFQGVDAIYKVARLKLLEAISTGEIVFVKLTLNKY